MIEREAQALNIVGTADHLALREKESAAVLERFREWHEKMTPLFEPKSAMGQALRYISNQWPRLTAFLLPGQRLVAVPTEDARYLLAEGALRVGGLDRDGR